MTNIDNPLGRIIILNGTSSAGKSTIASSLKKILPPSFCYFASDQLAENGFRAAQTTKDERARFFAGFHNSIASFASCGNDLIVEHIVEEQAWADELKPILAPFDTFWVELHCDLETLKQRERLRGDRALSEAEFHFKTHTFCEYDFEINSGDKPDFMAAEILNAWTRR